MKTSEDWMTKLLKAIQEGNNWQFTSSVYGLLQDQIVQLQKEIDALRLELLEFEKKEKDK